MRIGKLDLGPQPLFLAPMEDVTDRSFRLLCKRFGADVVCSEFVNADGLVRGALSSEAKLHFLPEERPYAIQIYGQHADSLLEAARRVDGVGPDLIDLNFGCPVKKIAGRGAGAGMLRDPDRLVELAGLIVREVRHPVTVKTRLGWDEHSIIIEDLAERLQDVGVAAITVHGRTRAQMYRGSADWGPIGRLKRNPRLRIPVVGNGDITSPELAQRAFQHYGVDGVMIGRATFGKPWIFREIRHFLQTGEHLPPLGIEDRVRIAQEQLQLSLESKGEVRGVLELRRHLSCYFKGLPNFRAQRLSLLTERDPAVLSAMLDDVAIRYAGWTPEEDDVNMPWAVSSPLEDGCAR